AHCPQRHSREGGNLTFPSANYGNTRFRGHEVAGGVRQAGERLRRAGLPSSPPKATNSWTGRLKNGPLSKSPNSTLPCRAFRRIPQIGDATPPLFRRV